MVVRRLYRLSLSDEDNMARLKFQLNRAEEALSLKISEQALQRIGLRLIVG
jgi:hypothetical protein